jgi:hypothetical protein
MAKYSLIGSTVSIGGESSCVESGDIDFGELNMVETTCSTDKTRTFVPGTFENATGSVTINDTGALADWLDDFGDDSDLPAPVTIVFTWPDAGNALVSVLANITNVSLPVGVDQAATITFTFTGTAGITFTP